MGSKDPGQIGTSIYEPRHENKFGRITCTRTVPE
jgi:hypothetical protein